MKYSFGDRVFVLWEGQWRPAYAFRKVDVLPGWWSFKWDLSDEHHFGCSEEEIMTEDDYLRWSLTR